ncbi:hypothetical protein C0991_001067 [Blastosporella zonata]|nr:hypothetical protein C0991_001067 [Blastosporella zonata]
MAGRFLVAAAFCPFALAFSNTVPFLTWSSYPSKSLERLPSTISQSQTLLDTILQNEEVCGLDAVILVGQEGLHASDLRTLSPSSKFAQLLSEYTSQRQFQYVRPHQGPDLSAAAETLAARCGFRTITLTPGAVAGHFSHDSKNVVNVRLQSLEGQMGGSRKDRVSLYSASVYLPASQIAHTWLHHTASQLANELEYLSSTYPNHLVVYTGTSATTFSVQHEARQQPESDFESDFESLFAAPNTTLAEGGILKRYQLLTPGLITVLLISFFILLPILLFGFSALASIQSPLETRVPIKFSADDKKKQ